MLCGVVSVRFRNKPSNSYLDSFYHSSANLGYLARNQRWLAGWRKSNTEQILIGNFLQTNPLHLHQVLSGILWL